MNGPALFRKLIRGRMNPELRAALLERLAHRSERLARVAKIENAPDAVISLMAEHVLRTAIAICGEQLQKTVLSELFDRTHESFGICTLCHVNKVIPDERFCEPCLDQIKREDAETDFFSEENEKNISSH